MRGEKSYTAVLGIYHIQALHVSVLDNEQVSFTDYSVSSDKRWLQKKIVFEWYIMLLSDGNLMPSIWFSPSADREKVPDTNLSLSFVSIKLGADFLIKPTRSI